MRSTGVGLSVSEILTAWVPARWVHRTEVARAIVMIARRRAKVDDRHRDLLPDSGTPIRVKCWITCGKLFGGPDIPRWVLQAEVSDALTLNNWLWWKDRRRELFFLKAGRARGVFLSGG